MKLANISTIKNQLSKYLNYVKKGERVRILDRDRAVADLVPVTADDKGEPGSLLASLESQGIIKRGTGQIPKSLLVSPSTDKDDEASGVLDALLDERKTGR